ncbi:MAG: hypothetical protein FJ125_15560, partial [Deltaproteobacteria bacterium]|nr:hypothetical protein [Deltaproteobacteria bacterium]
MSTSTGTPGDLRRHLGLLRLTSDDSTTVAARLPWSTRPGRGPTGRGGLAPPLFWYWLGRQLGLEEGEQGRQQSARTLAEVRRRWLAACGELLPAALGDLPAPGGLAARLAAARRLVGELAPRLGFVAGSAADPPLLVVPWGSCPEVEGPAVPWDMTLNLDEGSAGAGARTGEEQLTEALRARGRPWGLLGDGRRWWLRLALPYPALPVGVDIDLAPILEEGDPLGWSLFVAVASCGALTPDGGADGRCPWERRLAEAERWQQQLEAELLHGAKRAGQLLAGAGARREGEGSRGRGRARAHARLQASTSAGASWAAARRIVLRCWAQLLGEARGRLRLLLLADGRACGWPELKQEWRRLASTLGSSLFRAEGRGAPEIGEPPPELLTAALDELRRIVLPGSCTALASA